MSLEEIVREWRKEAIRLSPSRCIVVVPVEDIIYIVSDRSGLLIGYHGRLVDKYKNILRENGYSQRVVFIDTFVGDVKVLGECNRDELLRDK